MKYIARFSNTIQEDIKRNWSSWNFGQDGITCTENELDKLKQLCINDKSECTVFYISGFEFTGSRLGEVAEHKTSLELQMFKLR